MINALKKASASDKKELCDWLALKEFDSAEKINAVTDIYDKLNIKELTNSRIKDFYNQAIASLEHLNRPEEKKTELFNFASYLMERQK